MTTHEIITQKAQLPVYFDIHKTHNMLVPSHWHTHMEVLYLLNGSMHIVRNEEKYTIHKHDLFVVNSGDIHYTLSAANTEVLLLQIPYEFLNQSIQQFHTIHFREYYSNMVLKEDEGFQRMIVHLLRMKDLYNQAEEGYQFLFSSNLYLFLHLLYTHYSTRQNQMEKNKDMRQLTRLREIIAYVEQHYMEPLTLKDACSLVALNPEYFCRTFKRYMGFSFMEYVNLVRLTHIHKDLLDTEESVTTIQERHGFRNYKVFNRLFKEVYGCPPSKIRASKL